MKNQIETILLQTKQLEKEELLSLTNSVQLQIEEKERAELHSLLEKCTYKDINTPEELDDFVNNDVCDAFPPQYVFRGLSKRSELMPTLMRAAEKQIPDKIDNTNKEAPIEKLEFELIKDLVNNGSLFLKDYHPIDLLTTAQHFGLPTRGMDWSYNFFTALFFAKGLNPNKEYYYVLRADLKENIVWEDIPLYEPDSYNSKNDFEKRLEFLHDLPPYASCYYRFQSLKKYFNPTKKEKTKEKDGVSNATGSVNNDTIKYIMSQYYEMMPTLSEGGIENNARADKKKIMKKRLLFIKPNFNNVRISSQQGVLYVPTILNPRTIEKSVLASCCAIRIKISEPMKKHIDKLLSGVGINGYRILPDLENTCKNIRLKERKQ